MQIIWRKNKINSIATQSTGMPLSSHAITQLSLKVYSLFQTLSSNFSRSSSTFERLPQWLHDTLPSQFIPFLPNKITTGHFWVKLLINTCILTWISLTLKFDLSSLLLGRNICLFIYPSNQVTLQMDIPGWIYGWKWHIWQSSVTSDL